MQSSTKDAALEPSAIIVTSAYPVKAITPKLPAIECGTDPSCELRLASSLTITIECDNAHRQLHHHCRLQLAYSGLSSEALQQQQNSSLHVSNDNSLLSTNSNNYNHTSPVHMLLNPEHHFPFTFGWKLSLISKTFAHSRTPINISGLISELFSHPDRHFVDTLIGNLINGCNIGYTGPHSSPTITTTLTQLTSSVPLWTPTLQKNARLVGPFEELPLLCFCYSGLGLVPKHDGGWQTLCDLSAPMASASMTILILFTLTYCSVDNVYAIINSLGTDALMSKIDLIIRFV